MTPTSAIARFELGSTFQEFNLRMNMLSFIAASVFRPIEVGTPSASIGKIPLKQLLQSASTQRAPGSGYARDKFEFETWGYSVKEYGKESPLDDAEAAIYGDIVDGEQISANRAEEAVLNEYERDVAAAVMNTGNFSAVAAGTLWTNQSQATPILNVQTAIEQIAGAGIDANALVLSASDYRNLMQTDDIRDSIKYTDKPTFSVIKTALADLLGIKYVLVAGGFKNTANENQAASVSRIWGSGSAWVGRIAESNDPREVCAGRTFIWPGDGPSAPGDGGTLAVIMEEYREEGIRGTVFRARNNRDIQVMYGAAGRVITGIAA